MLKDAGLQPELIKKWLEGRESVASEAAPPKLPQPLRLNGVEISTEPKYLAHADRGFVGSIVTAWKSPAELLADPRIRNAFERLNNYTSLADLRARNPELLKSLKEGFGIEIAAFDLTQAGSRRLVLTLTSDKTLGMSALRELVQGEDARVVEAGHAGVPVGSGSRTPSNRIHLIFGGGSNGSFGLRTVFVGPEISPPNVPKSLMHSLFENKLMGADSAQVRQHVALWYEARRGTTENPGIEQDWNLPTLQQAADYWARHVLVDNTFPSPTLRQLRLAPVEQGKLGDQEVKIRRRPEDKPRPTKPTPAPPAATPDTRPKITIDGNDFFVIERAGKYLAISDPTEVLNDPNSAPKTKSHWFEETIHPNGNKTYKKVNFIWRINGKPVFGEAVTQAEDKPKSQAADPHSAAEPAPAEPPKPQIPYKETDVPDPATIKHGEDTALQTADTAVLSPPKKPAPQQTRIIVYTENNGPKIILQSTGQGHSQTVRFLDGRTPEKVSPGDQIQITSPNPLKKTPQLEVDPLLMSEADHQSLQTFEKKHKNVLNEIDEELKKNHRQFNDKNFIPDLEGEARKISFEYEQEKIREKRNKLLLQAGLGHLIQEPPPKGWKNLLESNTLHGIVFRAGPNWIEVVVKTETYYYGQNGESLKKPGEKPTYTITIPLTLRITFK